jgi:6-pyruvoyltetrahydropterin/6-carboxytetrahydropterin synthase
MVKTPLTVTVNCSDEMKQMIEKMIEVVEKQRPVRTTVVKIFRDICYCHFLPYYKGKCNRMHGHNGTLEVEFEGEIEQKTGMIVDFLEIKKIVQSTIVDRLDHQPLNISYDKGSSGLDDCNILSEDEDPGDKYFCMRDPAQFNNPTAENIAVWIWETLHDNYPKYNIVRIRFWETSNSYVEIKR